jgi:hypothetical protein
MRDKLLIAADSERIDTRQCRVEHQKAQHRHKGDGGPLVELPEHELPEVGAVN